MTRSFRIASITFAALVVAGVFLAVLAAGLVPADEADALRSIGAALVAGGLAAFLVEAFRTAADDAARRDRALRH